MKNEPLTLRLLRMSYKSNIEQTKREVFREFLQQSQNLFWDVDVTRLHPEQSKGFIIERILNRGDIKHFQEMMSYYGFAIVKSEIKKAGYFDKKTLHWLSLLFDLPLNQFKCYKKQQSSHIYWNY